MHQHVDDVEVVATVEVFI